jgi:propanediol dehydratase large subunit
MKQRKERSMARSRRFEVLSQRDVNKETFVTPFPEAGLIASDSPADPQPSVQIGERVVVEMDGKQQAEFDVHRSFIAAHGLI